MCTGGEGSWKCHFTCSLTQPAGELSAVTPFLGLSLPFSPKSSFDFLFLQARCSENWAACEICCWGWKSRESHFGKRKKIYFLGRKFPYNGVLLLFLFSCCLRFDKCSPSKYGREGKHGWEIFGEMVSWGESGFNAWQFACPKAVATEEKKRKGLWLPLRSTFVAIRHGRKLPKKHASFPKKGVSWNFQKKKNKN